MISEGLSRLARIIWKQLHNHSPHGDHIYKKKEKKEKKIDNKIKETLDELMQQSAEKTNPGTSYARAASKAPEEIQPGSKRPCSDRTDTEWYWRARRCLRFFPIEGATDEHLLRALADFILNKMKIPTGLLDEKRYRFYKKSQSE